MSGDGPRPRPVFLLSLPRAGSTLLQRMLGAHSAVATRSEPWLMLPLVSTLSSDGIYARYGHRHAVQAITDLAAQVDGGAEGFRDELRELALRVYARASDAGSVYFLDKSPRYHLIVDEVLTLFPDAPVLVLWRNPLAVVSSMMDTWTPGRWMPHLHKVDLYSGLERLLTASMRRPQRFLRLRFEDLLAHPERELRRVTDHLGLAWEPAVLEEFASTELRGAMGDLTGRRAYATVSPEPLDKWRSTLRGPIRRAWCGRYLEWIGSERLAWMGYDLDELRAELQACPTRLSTVPRDAVDTVRGVAWCLLEPEILRGKLATWPRWRDIYSHQ